SAIERKRAHRSAFSRGRLPSGPAFAPRARPNPHRRHGASPEGRARRGPRDGSARKARRDPLAEARAQRRSGRRSAPARDPLPRPADRPPDLDGPLDARLLRRARRHALLARAGLRMRRASSTSSLEKNRLPVVRLRKLPKERPHRRASAKEADRVDARLAKTIELIDERVDRTWIDRLIRLASWRAVAQEDDRVDVGESERLAKREIGPGGSVRAQLPNPGFGASLVLRRRLDGRAAAAPIEPSDLVAEGDDVESN